MNYWIVLLVCVSTTSAWFFSPTKKPEWDGLRATFGLNPFSSKAFTALPRTMEDAVADDWTPDSTALSCGLLRGKAFYGKRYRKNGDPATMVLFDKNGFIAGIQAGIPKTRTSIYPGPQHDKYGVFTEEDDLWVITAYFIEPSRICQPGRTQEEFDAEGTGNMLAIQTGPTPDSLMRAPMSESDVLPTTKYVQGKCFYGMGMHYWYNATENMSCDDTFPVFLMYNDGKLTAFGWTFNIYFDTSERWEHPPSWSVFGGFINKVPKCLGVDDTVTVLHMYLTNDPWYNRC